MMKRNILLIGFLSSLIACGGGGGGHNADDGGFQQPKAPELNVSINPQVILPNPLQRGYEGLSGDAKALITVYARQGNKPIENGDTELQISLNDSIGTTRGYIYCFELGNEACTRKVKDSEGNDVEILNALGKVQLDLAAGRGMFAVTAQNGKVGEIGLNITIDGPNGATVSKDILVPVKYASSGIAHKIAIHATDILKPNHSGNISISISDEEGNPVNDPSSDNLVVTASNLSGTTLGFNGKTGFSVTGKSANGNANISILPTQEGFLTITAQSDKDNNISDGIQNLMQASKTIRVTRDALQPNNDVVITGGDLPNGVVGVEYGDFIISTTGTVTNFSIESGSLPPGLNFNRGVINGVPTLEGEYTFTVVANGLNGNKATKEMKIKVIKGGFKFNLTSFESLNKIEKNLDPDKPDVCENVGQILTIVPNQDYVLKPPFSWKMDAGGVETALGVNKAKRVVTANGIDLPNLDFTVTNDTTQVTLNGKVCPNAPSDVFNGHAIILSATDANGFVFESILPLAINLKVNAYKPPSSDEPDDSKPNLTLANGVQGQNYSVLIPDVDSLNSGSIPPGLSLNAGAISGIPTSPGVYSFSVNLKDGSIQNVSITIATP